MDPFLHPPDYKYTDLGTEVQYFLRFLKKPKISDYKDYEAITLIRSGLKTKKNLCNLSFKSL